MRWIRPFMVVVAGVLIAASAPLAEARTLVDPTTLTPPLKPNRICYQLGPTVQCDTSGDVTNENVEADELPCGLLDGSSHEVSNSTRFYQDGLLVRRAVQEQITGTWSLSPIAAGADLAWAVAGRRDERVAI